MTRFWQQLAAILLFALVHFISAHVDEASGSAVTQAIIWLPTGVAIAGLWLLGLRYWWVLAISTFVQRHLLGYEIAVSLPATLGSVGEAVLGVLVLQRLGFQPALARLRDVLILFVAAALAPLASILSSWVARLYFWSNPSMPFYSGWDGWWRMNALGILAVVPLATTWLAAPSEPQRSLAPYKAWATATGITAAFLGLLSVAPQGPSGIVLLNLVLPVSLYSAVRFGSRGGAAVGALAAIVISFVTARGIGPFLGLPREDRHVVLQIFELALVTVPLIFGALIVEREIERARGLETEELRRSTQKALPDITYCLSGDGRCVDLYVPEGTAEPFQRQEVVGRRVSDFLPPEAAERVAKTIRSVLARRTAVTIEYNLTVKGRRRIHEARCVPYGAGEILAMIRDITDRTLSERSTAFEAQVLELVATGRPATEVFAEIVGGMEQLTQDGRCSIALLEGNWLRVVTAPSLPEKFNSDVGTVEIGPHSGSCGTAAFTGKTVVVEDIASSPLWDDCREAALPHGVRACWSVPMRDSNGQVLGTFSVYYPEPCAPETAELQRAERAGALAGIALERERRGEALRRSEELLASINRNVNEGLYRVTPDLRVVYANFAFARMFGYDSPEELTNISGDSLFDDPDRRESIGHQIAKHGHFVNEEVLFRRRDGSRFWGLISGMGWRDSSGTITHFDGAVADITARKELEEQFRQSQKMEAVGKLAGGVAHDFNNLLTVIFGYTEAIRDAVPPGSEVHANTEEVLKASERAANLTRQLLAYSRQQVLSPQVLDLKAVVEGLSGMLGRLIGEDIRLVTRHGSGEAWVRVDRGQLEQVILNLVVNARDAMPGGGELGIATAPMDVDESFARTRQDLQQGPYVILSVYDTGVGMPPEVQRRAFDPFFTTKELGRGTGLGLATVYGIVKQSGGAVWLESEPGSGTTAWIYLPRVQPAVDAPTIPVSAHAGSTHVTILVVEDEVVVRNLVKRTLVGEGHNVLEARDGMEALEVSHRHTGDVDLIVTDVVMPRLGGREFVAQLLVERPGLPVLFMSGYTNDAPDLQEVSLSAADFLQKPFTPQQLLTRVRALLPSA